MKTHLLLTSTALFALLTTAYAARESRTTARGTGADTSVRGGDLSTRSFGNLDILRVRNATNLGGARKTYLRFDLKNLPASLKTLKSAAITLTIAPAEGTSPPDKTWTFEVFGLKDGSAGEDWAEGTANWENAPANDVKAGSAVTDETVSLGTFTITGPGEAGKTIVFNADGLTQFLKDDTNGQATVIITRQEAGDSPSDNVVHIFASKENANLTPPTLVLGLGE